MLDLKTCGLIDTDDMNALMDVPGDHRQALRTAISEGLREGSPQQDAWVKALSPQTSIELTVPCHIGDYTDFYTSVHHATTVGKQFRPDNPLLPNYKWVPIGYHGRASSIIVSGKPFARPQGQTKAPEADVPSLGPSRRLDYELELGWFIGRGNAQGQPIGFADAEQHLFGVSLFNDWSARDMGVRFTSALTRWSAQLARSPMATTCVSQAAPPPGHKRTSRNYCHFPLLKPAESTGELSEPKWTVQEPSMGKCECSG